MDRYAPMDIAIPTEADRDMGVEATATGTNNRTEAKVVMGVRGGRC